MQIVLSFSVKPAAAEIADRQADCVQGPFRPRTSAVLLPESTQSAIEQAIPPAPDDLLLCFAVDCQLVHVNFFQTLYL